MRSFTFSLNASPLALNWLVTITRVDGTVLRLVNTQRNLTISGQTWTGEPGMSITNVEYYSDGTISNTLISVALHAGGAITAADIAVGKYRNATLSMQIVNIFAPALGSAHFTGYLGAVTLNTRDSATLEGRGQLVLGTTVVVETYQAMDLADLGDFRNKIPILPPDVQRSTAYETVALDHWNQNLAFVRARVGAAGNPSDYANLYWECTTAGTTASVAPAYTGNVGDVVIDGGAHFTARNAWLRYGQVGSVTDAFHFTVVNLTEPRAVDGWFKQGQALLRSGNGNGLSIETRDWTQAGNIVFAALPVTGLIAPGDWLELIPGYDHTAKTAYGKFNDIVNFRGDPFAPAPGAILSPTGSPLTPGTPGSTGGTVIGGISLVPGVFSQVPGVFGF